MHQPQPKEMPLIDLAVPGSKPIWHVYAPNGRFIAEVHCDCFLRHMLIDMFGLGPFDSIPKTPRLELNKIFAAYEKMMEGE